MTDYTDLLDRIAQRTHGDEPDLPAPIGELALRQAEAQLGFGLHPLLAVVYRQVGNGGLGPEDQLLSLIDGPTPERAVTEYLNRRSVPADSPWARPEGVLPILHWGRAMISPAVSRAERGRWVSSWRTCNELLPAAARATRGPSGSRPRDKARPLARRGRNWRHCPGRGKRQAPAYIRLDGK